MGIRSGQYLGDPQEFRALVGRSGVSASRFAALMGASRSTIHQYLSGRREVPQIALSAARWAALVLGVPVKISGGELERLRPRRARRRTSVLR